MTEPVPETGGQLSENWQVREGNYTMSPRGITWLRPGGNGPTEVPLTNFAACITSDVRRDDGAEVRREYEVATVLNGRRARFTVPASQFRSMNWMHEHLGAEAIMSPGQSLRDHAAVAIQRLSTVMNRDGDGEPGGIPGRSVYAHTGWRQLPGGYGYLTASGAITAAGLDESVTVQLGPALAGYDLPAVRDGSDVRDGVRASLAILDVAPDSVTVPMLGAAYRAALPLLPDCSVWLYGPSGTMKTSISALAQQHFGARLDAYSLPGNWTSTANMLELQAFTLANALLTVDDYSPDASTIDARKRAATADRLLRGSANHTGRGRLNSDSSMRPVKPPRAQVLTSAEDLPPAGQSLRARVMVSEVARGAVRPAALSASQEAAGSGQLATAMSGYVQILAVRYSQLQSELRPRLAELRDAARASGHPRVAVNIASLMLGWEQWLHYAVDAGAIDTETGTALYQRAWKALCDLGADQDRYQADADPAGTYLRALAALVTSGRAHLAARDGSQPGEPGRYGWRFAERSVGTTWDERRGQWGVWEPQGALIGWVTDDGVFLDPAVAYRAARQFAEQAGTPLGVSDYALRQQMHDRRLLASTGGPGRLTVQRRLGDRKRDVLHLGSAAFDGDSQ